MPFTPRLVFVTASSLEEARNLAQGILEKHLAACVNLVPGVESHYRWQGKLETAAEVMLVIKSSAEQFEALAGMIRRATLLRVSRNCGGGSGGNVARIPGVVEISLWRRSMTAGSTALILRRRS